MIKKPFIKKNIIPLFIILGLVFITGISFSKYPYFEGDEGIYVSRARAFIEQGKLSTDVYWYDHPPLGWIFISPFIYLNKITNIFESNLIAGRFLIFILSFLNAYFLYKISEFFFKASNRTKSILAGAVVILFVTSPLQIYFGRRVLLDNLVVFWLLASIYTYLRISSLFKSIIISALLFGLAVLTKENAIIFIVPFLTLLIFFKSEYKIIKKLSLWLIVFIFTISFYPLYAYTRGELFLNNYFSGGNTPSLISTLLFQANRNKSAIFDFVKNPFWKYLKFWFEEDTVLIGLGFIIAFTLLVIGLYKKHNKALVISLFGLCQLIFLARGGVVYEFYILPVLPFLALNIVYFYYYFLSKYVKENIFNVFILIVIPFILLNLFNSSKIKNYNPFFTNQTKGQLETINYIKNNVSENSFVISDSFLKADFYNSNIELKSHLDVEYNRKLKTQISNSTKNVNYIVYTKQLDWDLSKTSFIKNIIYKSDIEKYFISDGWDITIFRPY